MTIAELLEQKGRAEGEARGRAEGEAKNKIDVALGMLEKGLPVSDILEITGLSRNQINRLAADLQ